MDFEALFAPPPMIPETVAACDFRVHRRVLAPTLNVYNASALPTAVLRVGLPAKETASVQLAVSKSAEPQFDRPFLKARPSIKKSNPKSRAKGKKAATKLVCVPTKPKSVSEKSFPAQTAPAEPSKISIQASTASTQVTARAAAAAFLAAQGSQPTRATLKPATTRLPPPQVIAANVPNVPAFVAGASAPALTASSNPNTKPAKRSRRRKPAVAKAATAATHKTHNTPGCAMGNSVPPLASSFVTPVAAAADPYDRPALPSHARQLSTPPNKTTSPSNWSHRIAASAHPTTCDVSMSDATDADVLRSAPAASARVIATPAADESASELLIEDDEDQCDDHMDDSSTIPSETSSSVEPEQQAVVLHVFAREAADQWDLPDDSIEGDYIVPVLDYAQLNYFSATSNTTTQIPVGQTTGLAAIQPKFFSVSQQLQQQQRAAQLSVCQRQVDSIPLPPVAPFVNLY